MPLHLSDTVGAAKGPLLSFIRAYSYRLHLVRKITSFIGSTHFVANSVKCYIELRLQRLSFLFMIFQREYESLKFSSMKLYKKDKSKKLKQRLAILNNDPDEELVRKLLTDYYFICRKYCTLKMCIWQYC